MRRLSLARRPDQGAVATIFALFMLFVMLGLGALTVDVGNINADRRQLQNGADAIALQVAQGCAATGTCLPNDPTLQALANTNAGDGATEIRRVDGQTPAICGYGTGLTACPSVSVPSTSNLQECPAPATALPAGTNYVRVYTETKNAAGTHLLPYSFGAAIAGVGPGADQQTCSSAAWGVVGQYTASVPITISLCMFDAMMALYGTPGALPQPPSGAWPGYGTATGHAVDWPPATAELKEYTTKYAGTCTNSNGHAANGSFGWLTNSSCNVGVTTGNWVSGDPGNNEQCNMAPYRGKTLMIPIYDCVVSGTPPATPTTPCSIPSGGGSNIWYHITGWASFYLSGYRFPSDSQASVRPPYPVICSSPESCLGGWLTKATLSGAPIGGSGGGNYGVSAVQVVG